MSKVNGEFKGTKVTEEGITFLVVPIIGFVGTLKEIRSAEKGGGAEKTTTTS